MFKDAVLKKRWETIVAKLSEKFADGEMIDLDAILYLIGVQELGKHNKAFNKSEKIDLMHIAICRLLEPYGYYEFEYFDNFGWPHFKAKEKMPYLKAGEQTLLMKEAVVNYFLTSGYIK